MCAAILSSISPDKTLELHNCSQAVSNPVCDPLHYLRWMRNTLISLRAPLLPV